MFEWEPRKINLKDVPWLLIIGVGLIFFGLVAIAKADPTTAPISNIVRIHIDDPNGSVCGTGFIFEKGRVLTARHVVLSAKKQLIIRYSNGVVEKVKRKKCRLSKNYDLAEIPVKKDKVGVKLEISYSGDYIGKRLYTSGYPDNWGILWVSIGVMSSDTVSFPYLKKVFLSDIDAIGGSSGSPVFDYTDRLVGVISSKYLCVVAVVSTEALEEFLDE